MSRRGFGQLLIYAVTVWQCSGSSNGQGRWRNRLQSAETASYYFTISGLSAGLDFHRGPFSLKITNDSSWILFCALSCGHLYLVLSPSTSKYSLHSQSHSHHSTTMSARHILVASSSILTGWDVRCSFVYGWHKKFEINVKLMRVSTQI